MIRLPKLRGNGLHPSQSYTPAEVARAAGVSEATVRTWIRENKLPAMTKGTPYLVLGCDANAFFRNLRAPTKHLSDGELNCMHCRAGRKPMGGMVDFILRPGAKMARLEALCEVCEGKMSRGVSVCELPRLNTLFEVQARDAAGN